MNISNELRVGIMFFTGLILLVLLILTMTRWGQDRNAYSFSLVFAQAAGIQPGAEVRVSGVKVGQVSAVSLDPSTNKALVTVRVGRQVALHTGYAYTIGVGGLVGERFIDIRPTAQPGEEVKAGDRIAGTTTPDISDLILTANKVVKKLSTTADSINAMVGDKEMQQNLKRAVADLQHTTAASARFVNRLDAMAQRNTGEVDLIVANLRSISDDLRVVSDQITPQLANTRIFANIEQASQNVVGITERLEAVAKSAETVLGDDALGAALREATLVVRQSSVDLRKIMADAQQAVEPLPRMAANLETASADLPAITGPLKATVPEVAENVLQISRSLRRTSETIGSVAQGVTKLGASLASINVEPEARLAFMTGGDAVGRSDFNVDLRMDNSMFRVGVADLGNSGKFNAQLGNRFGKDLWFRYGIVESTFGAGADYRLNDRWLLTGEAFDPAHPKVNLVANYRFAPFGKGWWLNTGWYRALESGEWGIGVTYRPNTN